MNSRDMFYYLYDKPVPYKELTLYPVTMRDYYPFNYYSDCLVLENDAKVDPSKIKMSVLEYTKRVLNMNYLEFLYFNATQENNLLSKLHAMLGLVLKREDFEIGKNIWYGYEEGESQRGIIKIDGIIYNGEDFDEIRTIISEANLIELPNMNTQREIREAIKVKRQMTSGTSKMGDIEDLIVALSISTGFELEYIYDLPIRKFSKMLERVDAKLHYELYTTASLSGMVEFKDKSFIKHWLSNLKTNELDDVLMTLDSVKDKVSMNDLKK